MAPYRRHHRLTAWGQHRTVADWAADARCSVDYVTILQRIERGWSPEEAITTPSLRRYELTAWGETKRLYEWTRDPRCRAPADTIASRIARGWSPEEAITTQPDVRLPQHLTLGRETKTIAAWARDPRCVPDVNTLRRRLQLGWSLADALSVPVRPEVRLTAWGETKRLPAWLADARCVVERSVLEARLQMGWHPAAAMTVSSDPEQIEAFGETRAVGDWARDACCVVSDELLRSRLANGWHPEEAITEPLKSHVPRQRMLSAFGETKAVADWAEDRRCAVLLGTLRKRLREGWEAEKALTTPRRVGHLLTAWGETKSLAEWFPGPEGAGRAEDVAVAAASGLGAGRGGGGAVMPGDIVIF